jgi:LysM repeat protein
MRFPLLLSTLVGLTFGSISCAIHKSEPVLSPNEKSPGALYEVGVYVIAKGDSFFSISKKFRMSFKSLETLNPGVDSTRLRIGQEVRVYERKP